MLKNLIIIIIVAIIIVAGVFYWINRPESISEGTKSEETTQQTGGVQDCGVVGVNNLMGATTEELEGDSALVCLGNNIINDCKESKVKMTEDNLVYSISDTNTSDCKIKVEYPSVDEIFTEEQKQYANTYIECPLSGIVSVLNESNFSSEPFEFPGGYAFALFFQMGFMTLDPQQAREEYGCEGTSLDVWENLNK